MKRSRSPGRSPTIAEAATRFKSKLMSRKFPSRRLRRPVRWRGSWRLTVRSDVTTTTWTALDSCRAILGVARSIGFEPFLVSALVRLSSGEVAMKFARRVICCGEPSDASLGRLQAQFLEEMAAPMMLHAVRGERAVLDDMIRRLGTGELTLGQMADGLPVDPDAPRAESLPGTSYGSTFNKQPALELMNEAVAIEKQDAAARPALWRANEADYQWRSRQVWGKYIAMLAFKFCPSVYSVAVGASRYQCDLGATAILLAAERHRRKTGDWPPSISGIDRSILPAEPVDPYSGGSFRMARRDGQLFVYSIGPNHKDENGTYDRELSMKGIGDDFGASLWDVSLRRQPHSPEDEPAAQSTNSL